MPSSLTQVRRLLMSGLFPANGMKYTGIFSGRSEKQYMRLTCGSHICEWL